MMPRAPSQRRRWKLEDDEQLKSLIIAGWRLEQIAVELRRSTNAVRTRAILLRISLKRIKAKAK